MSVAVTAKKPTDSMFIDLKEGTQHMSIYQPYFYVIQDTRNGMYYAGAKWAKDANPVAFMVKGGYTTRSNIINKLISHYGLQNFVIRKIRIFQTAEEAQLYETRFLRKVNAKSNPNFYNGHNNDGAMDTIKMKIVMKELYGVTSALQSEEIQQKRLRTNERLYKDPNYNNREKARDTTLQRYGVDNAYKLKRFQEKARDTKEKNYGNPNYNNREKARDTTLEKYGVECTLQLSEVKEAGKITRKSKYGHENYNNRQKAKDTWIKLYGYDHPNKTEKNREILKSTAIHREKLKSSREAVLKIRQYQKIYGKSLKLGRAWFRKSDEYLNNIIRLLENEYGVL
jgi:hypothetical protein